MECVSRKRLCVPLSKGGLNIVDFSVKCTSLRLSNFVSLRDWLREMALLHSLFPGAPLT